MDIFSDPGNTPLWHYFHSDEAIIKGKKGFFIYLLTGQERGCGGLVQVAKIQEPKLGPGGCL